MNLDVLNKYYTATEDLRILRIIEKKNKTPSNKNNCIINYLNNVFQNLDSGVSDLYDSYLAVFESLPIQLIHVSGKESFQISPCLITMENWNTTLNWGLSKSDGDEYNDLPFHGPVKNVGCTIRLPTQEENLLPVSGINWHDCLKWCNARSEMEGLEPVYLINSQKTGVQNLNKKEVYRKGEQTIVHFNKKANGYRLPTESEWEWAARGGVKSKGYKYSGSDSLKAVGWYIDNSGHQAHPTGKKIANELGIYDMSGNLWEWCWDSNSHLRIMRGGCYNVAADSCLVTTRGCSSPDTRSPFIGLRLARNA